MSIVADELRRQLGRFGQEHVLAWWDELDADEQRTLAEQLGALDLDLISGLFGQREEEFELPGRERIVPLPWPDQAVLGHHRGLGEKALGSGEVAFIVVAGGQGSRLGFEHPKGMFPVGPVSNKCLFQIHVEKVLALRRRHGSDLPFLVMTSPATHRETVQFFAEQGCFGMPRESVHFFCQGTMPALDVKTGKLLMEAKGRLFLSPNGHGGTLTGLAASGLLDRMAGQGIRTFYYFQVDNPLVRLDDVAFIGQHLGRNAEVSSKVITKETPSEKLGNYALVDGRCTIIEYSDLPADLANARDDQGRLLLWAGNPAIHLFDIEFLRRVTQGATRIPWHVARKKVPYLDEAGNLVSPDRENALKFEMFIFDVLPLAERWTVVPTTRPLEFEPLKNAAGNESPATVRQALIDQAADWLARAGVLVPRGADGRPAFPLEISPLFALDADELAGKVDSTLRIDGERYLA